MKTLKKAAAAVLVCVITLGGLQGLTVRASSFPVDVPYYHWASGAIERVVALGLMTGVTAPPLARFGVNELVCHWTTVRVLAQLAGFRRTGATYEERMFFQMCYERHIDMINEYAGRFEGWRSDYNMEIAYLIELGILLFPELDDFMGIHDHVEQHYALIRQTFALYLVRLLGVEDVARNFVPTTLFADNHEINIIIQPYVYYLRHLGIVSGDHNNNFNPAAPVTRAMMAVMLDLTAEYMGFDGQGGQAPPHQEQPPQAQNVYAIATGEISSLFSHPGFRAIELTSRVTGERSIFPIRSGARITINQSLGAFEQFETGMIAVVALTNGEITEIITLSQAAPPPPPQQTQPPPQVTPGHGLGQVGDIRTGIFTDATVDGTILNTRHTADGWFIDVEIRWLNSFGEIMTTIQTYRLNPGAVIQRGQNNISFNDINFGDLATLTVTGLEVTRVRLEERVRNIHGTVISKRVVEGSRQGILTVRENVTDRVLELVTTDASVITRQGFIAGIPDWSDVRVGDAVTIQAEFNQIMTLAAIGQRRHRDVLVTGISITTAGSAITGIYNGMEETFPIIQDSGVDPYILRVGTMVRLTLDSLEVDNILILHDAQPQNMTGNIMGVLPGQVTVQNILYHGESRVLVFAEGMVVRDAVTGNLLSPAVLTRNMRVHVVFANFSGIDYVTEITIVSH